MTTETIPEHCTTLSELLTTSDLCAAFNRKQLTIILWRKRKGLPYIRISGKARDTIRYNEEEVRKWAQKTGREFKRGLERVRVGATARVRHTERLPDLRSQSVTSSTARRTNARSD